MQPPRVTSSRVVYENRWMRLHEDRTERADGTPGVYAWVEKPPAAVIVPRDGDQVWLIQQFRHPVGERFWEFPQGAWEDEPGAAAEDLARGELAEKTGLRAGRMEHLGRLFFACVVWCGTRPAWLRGTWRCERQLRLGKGAGDAGAVDFRERSCSTVV